MCTVHLLTNLLTTQVTVKKMRQLQTRSTHPLIGLYLSNRHVTRPDKGSLSLISLQEAGLQTRL